MSKERLVELLNKFKYDCLLSCKDGFITVKKDCDTCVVEQLADYLIANGVIVPQHQIGERIYQTDGTRIYESSIHEITYTASKVVYVTESIVFDESAIGTRIFFSREEVKAKLKENET